jgi:hypothetical protein
MGTVHSALSSPGAVFFVPPRGHDFSRAEKRQTKILSPRPKRTDAFSFPLVPERVGPRSGGTVAQHSAPRKLTGRSHAKTGGAWLGYCDPDLFVKLDC